MSVTLEKSDASFMLQALARLDLNPIRSGDLICFGNRHSEWINCATGESALATRRNANEIKVAYSTVIVEGSAAEHGWNCEQTGQGEFEITQQY